MGHTAKQTRHKRKTAQHRQITVTAGSPPTGVRVVDAAGVDIASIPHGQRNANFNGQIAAIVFTVNGIARTCNLDGLDWLDEATHIGLSTAIRRGEPVCTLEDLDYAITTNDIFAQTQGNRCVYMSNQRGHSGMICE